MPPNVVPPSPVFADSLFSVKCDDKRYKNVMIYHRIQNEKRQKILGVPE